MWAHNERGNVLVVFLILMPLLVMMIAASVEIVDTVSVSDVDVQESLAGAAKAAAGQISGAAQANATPRINSTNALNAFQDSLQYNLRLNSSMAPLPNTHYLSPPKFWLLIYNGYGDFVGDGAPVAKYYYFNGTSLAEQSMSVPSGFPATFYVSDTGINTTSGAYRVELSSPGVVAVIQIEAKRILGDVPVVARRWAAARIVCKEGSCHVN